VYLANLALQSLASIQGEDPLRHRVFGFAVGGASLQAVDERALASPEPARDATIELDALTLPEGDGDAWRHDLARAVHAVALKDEASRWEGHVAWWRAFWARSHVEVRGGDPDETDRIRQGWQWHRYLVACTGRGAYPVKFNGSIFNVPGVDRHGLGDPETGPDDRRWGCFYWFQNTRHIFWPMLAAGDYELMRPPFEMYRRALPLAEQRTRLYYGHGGAFFPETMTFWGSYRNQSYGWDRDGKPDGLVDSGYIRRYWQGGLELSAMMRAFQAHTADETFARETLLPIADAVVRFYDEHYPRDDRGRVRFYPAQVLESLWDALNPLPEIAGLTHVIQGLLDLPESWTNPEQRTRWQRLLGELPDLPQGSSEDGPVMLSAEAVYSERHNVENAELYAVWPYRLFGVGLPEIDLARRTWRHRAIQSKHHSCWHNDIIWAAHLGLALAIEKTPKLPNFEHAAWGPTRPRIHRVNHSPDRPPQRQPRQRSCD